MINGESHHYGLEAHVNKGCKETLRVGAGQPMLDAVT